jgi:alpha-L-arabinofuranosidase
MMGQTLVRRRGLRSRTRPLGVAVAVAVAVSVSALAGALPAQGIAKAADPPVASITGDSAAAGKPISDKLFGIFFEDINHAADGGLYPELVQNRSFEFSSVDNPAYNGLTAWSLDSRGGAAGSIAVASDAPLNDKNLNYLRLTSTSPGSGNGAGFAIRNSGFNTGLYLEAGKRYRFSFWARRDGTVDVPVRVRVENAAATSVYAAADTTVTSDGWSRYQGVLTATGTTTAGSLAVIVDGSPPAGTHVDLDMVSLLPKDTWKGHGLRKDLAEKIAGLHPSFLRFPGGCIANVGTYGEFPERARIYRWKDTIGPLERRPTNRNFWGYNQSYGIGFYEYLQFAEDLGAAPLPVVQVGVNGCGVTRRLTTPGELAPFIQDTLDLIEFANGSLATKWGAARAAMGHPKPFGLKYIALGNEESDPQFLANYPQFSDAVRARYPNVKVICNSGPSPNGTVFERNWQLCRDEHADLVDEHYYVSQAFLLNNADRYDSYDRNGPHVFLGEYAARASASNYNNFFSALSEAAYITGLQRNSDVVEMASYAPLLANASYVNWSPDLIWFDNFRSYGTPSYWVQRLFSRNRGDTLVPTTLQTEPEPIEQIGRVAGQFGSAVKLNGSTQYARLPAGIVSGLHDFTISTWVNPQTVDTWSRVFDFGSSTDVNMFLTVSAGSTPRFSITTTGGGNEQRLSGTTALPANQWTHLAVTLSGTTGTFYVNGVAVATNPNMTLSPSSLGATANNWIGKSQYDADPYLNATVDEFQIYDRALSQGELQSLMTSAGGTPGGGNVAWYRFDESGGNTALDSSGAGHDATLVTEPLGRPLYQVVTRDKGTGDVVVKVINARPRSQRTKIDLGPRRLSGRGTVTTLSAALTDVNSFAQPTKVAPVTTTVSGLGNRFVYDFPANSVTFIRLTRQ